MVTETRPAGGIVFHKTMDRPAMVEFYRGRVGMRVWLEQADCTILSHGNLLLGLCQREERTTEGILCEDRYVATVTPVGFPASWPQASPRRPLDLREA